MAQMKSYWNLGVPLERDQGVGELLESHQDGMLFGATANCTWLPRVLCQEALETFCASTDSQGTQFARKIVFQQVEHLKFGILLLPILTL